jgi:hypothetical protein
MLIFLLILAPLLGFSDLDVRNLKDKTFTRDNTYCSIGNKRLEIQVRGVTSQLEPGERKYGDWFFFYPEENKPEVLPLNSSQLSKYRLFEGTGKKSVCSKSYGFNLASDKVAILFLEENRPFLDKLSLQIFDTQTYKALQSIDTGLITDAAEVNDGGFIFRSFIEKQGGVNGTFVKDGVTFSFNNLDFPIWYRYTQDGFEIDPDISFEKYPMKNHFRDKRDFFKMAGWDEKLKKFKQTFLYQALNHELKKECILIRSDNNLTKGPDEDWRCD